MKAFKILALAVAANIAIVASAQGNALKINFNNGGSTQFDISKIDEVTFAAAQSSEETVVEEVNSQGCVDLGLPSGTLWATCNIGASSPYQSGLCFAWGEVDPKEQYNIFKGKFSRTKYSTLIEDGVIDQNGMLTANYDVATYLWGAPWRMPTVGEFEELSQCCTWVFVEYNPDTYEGGYAVVTGPNGNSIIIPAAGNYHGFGGEQGNYWTCNAYKGDDRSYDFFFDGDDRHCTKELRGLGLPVRAVVPPTSGTPQPIDPSREGLFGKWQVSYFRNIDLTIGEYVDIVPEADTFYSFYNDGIFYASDDNDGYDLSTWVFQTNPYAVVIDDQYIALEFIDANHINMILTSTYETKQIACMEKVSEIEPIEVGREYFIGNWKNYMQEEYKLSTGEVTLHSSKNNELILTETTATYLDEEAQSWDYDSATGLLTIHFANRNQILRIKVFNDKEFITYNEYPEYNYGSRYFYTKFE